MPLINCELINKSTNLLIKISNLVTEMALATDVYKLFKLLL